MIRPLPKIGMRIVKSAVAVFFVLCDLYDPRKRGCLLLFRHCRCAVHAAPMFPIACGWRSTDSRHLYRWFFGMLALPGGKGVFPPDQPIWQYLLVSVCIIPLIYVTLLEQPTASYTCVVFMSITVSPRGGCKPSYLFALDRCIDTLIGIAVSLCQSVPSAPAEKSPLPLCSVPGLPGRRGRTSLLHRIKLNQLIAGAARVAAPPALPPIFSRH